MNSKFLYCVSESHQDRRKEELVRKEWKNFVQEENIRTDGKKNSLGRREKLCPRREHQDRGNKDLL